MPRLLHRPAALTRSSRRRTRGAAGGATRLNPWAIYRGADGTSGSAPIPDSSGNGRADATVETNDTIAPKGVNGQLLTTAEIAGNTWIDFSHFASVMAAQSTTVVFTLTVDNGSALFANNTASGGNNLIIIMSAGGLDFYNPTLNNIIAGNFDGTRVTMAVVASPQGADDLVELWIGGDTLFDDASRNGLARVFTGSATTFASDDLLSIGTEYDAGPTAGNFTVGTFHELTLYDRQLTGDELAEVFRAHRLDYYDAVQAPRFAGIDSRDWDFGAPRVGRASVGTTISFVRDLHNQSQLDAISTPTVSNDGGAELDGVDDVFSAAFDLDIRNGLTVFAVSSIDLPDQFDGWLTLDGGDSGPDDSDFELYMPTTTGGYGVAAVRRTGSYYQRVSKRLPTTVAHWSLDEAAGATEVQNLAGDNLTGTIENSPLLEQSTLLGAGTSVGGTSIDFSDPSHINFGVANELDFIHREGVFTVQCWAELNPDGTFQYIVGNSGDDNQPGWAIRLNSADNIAVRCEPIGINLASGAVSAGFYHILWTCDGVTQRLFINGSEVDSSSFDINDSPSTTEVWIGGYSPLGALYFEGRIDEVSIAKEAVDATGAAALYSYGTGSIVTNQNVEVWQTRGVELVTFNSGLGLYRGGAAQRTPGDPAYRVDTTPTRIITEGYQGAGNPGLEGRLHRLLLYGGELTQSQQDTVVRNLRRRYGAHIP